MTVGLLFWILMLFALVLGVFNGRNTGWAWGPLGFSFLGWVLFLILGWHAFGAPIK